MIRGFEKCEQKLGFFLSAQRMSAQDGLGVGAGDRWGGDVSGMI